MQMSGYTKLFSSILASTIWQESKETKIIWITMLAAATKDGVVEAAIPGLAHMAHLTVAEAEEALKVLSSPDPYSRTPAFEGRRIQKCDGGWQILNHDKYREQMSAAERTEYNRVKQQETRARKKARQDELVSTRSATVSNGQNKSASQRHTEAKEDSEADTKEEPFLCEALNIYNSYPRKVAKPDAIRAIKKALANPPRGMNTTDWASQLLESTKRFAAANARSDPKYIPYLATWFNSERFNDDPETWKGSSAPAEKKPTPRDFFA